MGLGKLTQWEESVAKQERKRFRLMSVAIASVIVMCVVLWLVQNQLYGGVVNTGTGGYISSAIGVGLGLLMRSIAGKTLWEQPSEKQKKRTRAFIGIFIAMAIGGAIFLQESRLVFVQLLCAYVPIFWILKRQKTDCDENSLFACIVVLMTVMTLVGTFVGIKLMGLISLPSAERRLAAEGFTEIEYNTWMYDRWLDSEKDNGQKYYVFQAKKNGQSWQVAVDTQGRLPMQVTKEGCPLPK